MAYQFVHVETYSLKSGGAGVAAEAGRVPTHSRHVPDPRPPVVLAGTAPEEAWAEVERRHAAARSTVAGKDGVVRERRLRSDEQILLAAVASYPTPTAELDLQDPAFLDWQRRTLQQLEREHGPALSAVLHLDETHPHVHYLTAPDLEAGQRMADIHPGLAAKRHAGGRNGKKGEAMRAYTDAMRGYQDRFHEAVGQHHGHARLGPRSQRLTRAEWQARQAEGQRVARALRGASRIHRRAAVVARREEQLQEALQAAEARSRDLDGREAVTAAAERRSATIWGRAASIVTLGRRGVARRVQEAAAAARAEAEAAQRRAVAQARRLQASTASLQRQLDAEARRTGGLSRELRAVQERATAAERQAAPALRRAELLQQRLDQVAAALHRGDVAAATRLTDGGRRPQDPTLSR